MKPSGLNTKIFLDGGDPDETRKVIKTLGFLDGQTTNPSLISKNPKIQELLKAEGRLTQDRLMKVYQNVVQQISKEIPNGSISTQVYSDIKTSAQDMLSQGKLVYQWIPNGRIKYPTTTEGLKAAEESVRLGMRINMTLVFSQEQAAAIYSATKGATKGQVVISPFIGRLDDLGENGMSLIENILKMYENSDQHIAVLAASIRNMNHLLSCFKLNTHIVTLPFKTIDEWVDQGKSVPKKDFIYQKGELKDISYKELDLERDWKQFNLEHQLTTSGLEKFASDWNSLLS